MHELKISATKKVTDLCHKICQLLPVIKTLDHSKDNNGSFRIVDMQGHFIALANNAEQKETLTQMDIEKKNCFH